MAAGEAGMGIGDRNEGFQRAVRVDVEPRRPLQFPGWAKWMIWLGLLLFAIAVTAILFATGHLRLASSTAPAFGGGVSIVDRASPPAHALARAAESQVGRTVGYDAAYVQLDYPGGDVPIDRGVCTDVVVRAFREVGIDLQVKVHEDMLAAFDQYPHLWGLSEPDSNIDHRRVPNLQTYFTRHGQDLPVTGDPNDFQPGDVVTWKVAGRPHTGLVSTVVAPGGDRFCVVHNIGAGTQIEDRLFEWEITGHYRPL